MKSHREIRVFVISFATVVVLGLWVFSGLVTWRTLWVLLIGLLLIGIGYYLVLMRT